MCLVSCLILFFLLFGEGVFLCCKKLCFFFNCVWYAAWRSCGVVNSWLGCPPHLCQPLCLPYGLSLLLMFINSFLMLFVVWLFLVSLVRWMDAAHAKLCGEGGRMKFNERWKIAVQRQTRPKTCHFVFSICILNEICIIDCYQFRFKNYIWHRLHNVLHCDEPSSCSQCK